MILFLNVLKQQAVPSIKTAKMLFTIPKKEHYSDFTHSQDPGTGFVQTSPTREAVLLRGQAAGGLNPDTGGAYKAGK